MRVEGKGRVTRRNEVDEEKQEESRGENGEEKSVSRYYETSRNNYYRAITWHRHAN